MKFVTDHLTRHHLRHAPHRFFVALCLSPLHAGERYYQKKYCYNFVHAKKVFTFDLLLLIAIFCLASAAIGWRMYSPGTTDLIEFRMSTDANRIKTGDELTIMLTYRNRHDFDLINPQVQLSLPPTFILTESSSSTIMLERIGGGDTNTIRVTGRFYGTPQNDVLILAHLSYRPQTRRVREEKIAPMIIRAQESAVEVTLTSPSAAIPENNIPLTLQLINTSDLPLHVVVPFADPLPQPANIVINTGTTTPAGWDIATLLPSTTATLFADIALPDSDNATATIFITPTILVAGKQFPMATAKQVYTLVRPRVTVATAWQSDSPLSPGAERVLDVSIQNSGDEPIDNISLTLPLSSSMIDTNRLTATGLGTYANGSFRITSDSWPALAAIEPGQTITIPVRLPVRPAINSGEFLAIQPTVSLSATTPLVPNSPITLRTQSKPLRISSSLTLTPELRYYTDEGDQLGRGPLPPQVNKTTKYTAIIILKNTTNELTSVTWRGRLGASVVATGKKSVSHGNTIAWNETNHELSWTIPFLAPHEEAVASVEVAITPDASERGTTPTIIDGMRATATDEFAGLSLEDITAPLTTELTNDRIGRASGSIVR